jgi:hypothetical protein
MGRAEGGGLLTGNGSGCMGELARQGSSAPYTGVYSLKLGCMVAVITQHVGVLAVATQFIPSDRHLSSVVEEASVLAVAVGLYV